MFSILPGNVTRFGLISSSDPGSISLSDWPLENEADLQNQIFTEGINPTYQQWSLVTALQTAFNQVKFSQKSRLVGYFESINFKNTYLNNFSKTALCLVPWLIEVLSWKN